MPRLKTRRVVLGRYLYEVDADAVRGAKNGVYRVGTLLPVPHGSGQRFAKRLPRRLVVSGPLRVRIIAALVRMDEERAAARVKEPTVKDLTGDVVRVVRKKVDETYEREDAG